MLQDLLRKLAQDERLNWVEALPRVLRIHHDTMDPTMGMSPYQAVFGRERALGGVPWTTEKNCKEAEEYFSHMAEMDSAIAQRMNLAHEVIARRVNGRRHKRPPYELGDWVWVRRPKPVGGVKLQTWWRGPYQVEARVGDCSYKVRIPQKGNSLEVHADQLKPCIWEALTDQGVPLPMPAGGGPPEGGVASGEATESGLIDQGGPTDEDVVGSGPTDDCYDSEDS